MTARNVKIWYAAGSLFIVALIPFILFVSRPTLQHAGISLAAVSLVSVFYIFATKRITHPQDKYTAVQAMKFAQQCKKQGLRNSSNCKDNKKLFMQIAAESEALKNLEYAKALEAFQTGLRLTQEMKGR